MNKPARIIAFAWHVHHGTLLGALTESLEARAEYIRQYKSWEEIPLRLRLLKEMEGELPALLAQAGEARDQAEKAYDQAKKACDQAEKAYDQAGEARDQAGEARDQAGKACDQAREAYIQAEEAYVQAEEDCQSEIKAMHVKECSDCPWNGKTIFVRKNETGEWY